MAKQGRLGRVPPERAIAVLAHYLAKNAVKEQWQREGRKLREIGIGQITEAARAWVIEHPAIIDEARRLLERIQQRA
jgi:hypothetical protein